MSLPGDPSKIPPFVPLGPPPPGTTPNFAHPSQARYHRIIAALASTLTLALLFVLVRLYTRALVVRQFGADDIMCVVATILTIAFNVAVLQEIKWGLATSDWDLSLKVFLTEDLIGWIKWNAITALLYTASFAAVKLSILLLYLRIFGKTHTKTRICIWVVIVLTSIVAIAVIFGSVFACDPPKKLFLYSVPGTCNFVAVERIIRFQNIMQIVTDVFITAVPFPMLVQLKMPLAQKLGIMAILATGLFVTALSCVRLSYLYIKQTSTGISLSGEYPSTFWALFEVNLALVCASAPALKQFVGGSFPDWRSFTSLFQSRATGSGSTPKDGSGQSTKQSWSKKSSKDGSSEDRSGDHGIKQETSIYTEEHVRGDDAHLELGQPRTVPVPPSAYGPTTRVTASDSEKAATSS